MRKGRPQYHQLVILQRHAVDPNLHLHLKEATGQIPDFARRNFPDLDQGPIIIPGMIEKLNLGIRLLLLCQSQIQSMTNRLLTHRRMGSQCHHHIDLFRHRA